MQGNRRLHKCEQEGCEKQTKARFCEEHLPRCTKCGTKCRKFEDPATAVCFNHSQYLRDKTREKVARYRLIKKERKAAKEEIQSIVAPLILESKKSYVEQGNPIPRAELEWDEFVRWLRNNHYDVWLKYDMMQDAFIVIEGLSGEELRAYTEDIILQLNGLRIRAQLRMAFENS